ncbi:MAG TPA: hypothetical protein VGF48_10010 [Thermoanaerobaculia bacterium]
MKTLLTALLLVLIAPAMLADQLIAPAMLADEAAPFLIERIDVRNATRISPEIVISEARLNTGEAYRESQLREANDRLKRLPFLIDAQFALEKGSERGSYILVITVMETRPFFYLLDLTAYLGDNRYNTGDASNNQAIIGYRHFTGRKGMLHAGLYSRREERPYTSNVGTLEVGYTRFDLFGTRAFATVSLGTPVAYENDGDAILPHVVAGIPLSGNQTVTVEYEQIDHGSRLRRAERIASARWSFDTTNHPFFPTRGAIFSVGPVVSWSDVSEQGTATFVDPDVYVFHSSYAEHRTTAGLEGEVARFWEISPLWSIALRMDGGFAVIDERGSGDRFVPQDGSIAYGDASLRFTRMLVQTAEVEQRLELTLAGSSETRRDADSELYLGADEANGSAAVNWVRRDTWGTLRFGAGYAW